MRRLLAATLLSVLALAAPAAADDPLLSGYSGPGGGEQTVLGSELIGPAKSKGGSLRASPRQTAAPATADGAPTATTPVAPPLSPTPQVGGASSDDTDDDAAQGGGTKGSSGGDGNGSSASGSGSGSGSGSSTSEGSAKPATPAAGTTATPVQTESAGFPLTAGQLLAALVAVALLAGVALATRRLADTAQPA
jgi:hypothetical protein